MEKSGVLNLKVGQLAEMRTFERGFRGAWFRCKIKDILLEKNKILLEYYDYDDLERSWEKIRQVPPYARKSNPIQKQLMVRPQYPVLYRKSEMPPVNSISQVCIVIDGTWKVGDLVDWFQDSCYWSAWVVKELSNDKVQIELPMPPSGEGEEGEEGRHEAFSKDLRPSLEWSETEGWTLPTVDGQTSCDAQLIFPTKQDMDLEVENAAAAGGSPVNASSTTRISADGERDDGKTMKRDCDLLESSASISSLCVKKRKAADEEVENVIRRDLNIMHEHTPEAAITDLEELINKVNWMQRLLKSPSNDGTSSSWKFA